MSSKEQKLHANATILEEKTIVENHDDGSTLQTTATIAPTLPDPSRSLVLSHIHVKDSPLHEKHHEILSSTSLTSAEFLKLSPRAPYTVCRTIQHMRYCFMFEEHVKRLLYSWEIMFGGEQQEEGSTPPPTLEHLRTEIVRLFQDAVRHFAPEQKKHLDLKITILLTERQNIYLHFAPYEDLVGKQRHYVHFDIASGSRKDMPAKDSIWVQKMRDTLLKKKHPDSEEVLMCEDDGTLREGVSSNIFAIGLADDSTDEHPKYELYTAFEGIIFGTVRNLVLKVIDEHKVYNDEGDRVNIKVVKRDVNIRDLVTYKELFITSTSRLVMPSSLVRIDQELADHFVVPQLVRFDKHCAYNESVSHFLDTAVTKEMIAASHDLRETV